MVKPAPAKPLRWAVIAIKTGHPVAMFVVEQHAKNFAVGHRGLTVKEVGKQ